MNIFTGLFVYKIKPLFMCLVTVVCTSSRINKIENLQKILNKTNCDTNVYQVLLVKKSKPKLNRPLNANGCFFVFNHVKFVAISFRFVFYFNFVIVVIQN